MYSVYFLAFFKRYVAAVVVVRILWNYGHSLAWEHLHYFLHYGGFARACGPDDAQGTALRQRKINIFQTLLPLGAGKPILRVGVRVGPPVPRAPLRGGDLPAEGFEEVEALVRREVGELLGE